MVANFNASVIEYFKYLQVHHAIMADAIIEFDPEKTAKGNGVDVDEVYEIMKNGTGASPWVSKRIISELNLSKETKDWRKDGSSDEGDMEFKGITIHGVILVPSGMVGSGRKVDWEKLNPWLDGIPGGFVLHDNTQYPRVALYQIPTSTIREWAEDGLLKADGSVSQKNIMSALSELGYDVE
ncbi:MAG: Uncharacterised protein [Marine Group II euryarchaeote MED-G33]|nr:MAG: Uncharacterised protein [Marine Group II euryarchaeote MED-G33]